MRPLRCITLRASTASAAPTASAPTASADTGVAGTTIGAERPVIVLLHGYGMQPETYIPMAQRLTDRADVVIPGLWNVPGWWTFDRAVDCLECTLDDAGIGRVSLIAHSFGGALLLGFAARRPDRVVECVFGDTLGVNREVHLAVEAAHPFAILRMATPAAATAFVRSWMTRPASLATAALSAFVDDREADIETVASAGLPCHVLWADTDTVLSRADGRAFADRLHADFTVARRPPGYGPIDHDWMFDDPVLFADHLRELGLQALS
jgi:pimeloyl-ACP methyl ester carboxylesterase